MIKGSNQRRDVDCCLSSYQTAKSGDTVLPFDNLYYKSDRSSSCYEQSFLDVLEKIIQKCIYLPIYHMLTFYCLHFSKKKTPCFLHFSKAKLSISLHFSKIKTCFFLHFISSPITKGWTPNLESSPLTLFSLSVSIAADGVSHRPSFCCSILPTSLCIR